MGNVRLVAARLFGLRESIAVGLRAASLPANRLSRLALVVWAICAWLVVTLYLPMAWDRYQLPIQSGNALLAAVGITCLWDRLAAALGPGSRSRGLDACGTTCGKPASWVFLILLGSYAFFWHTRDWNTASRLMLTYSLVDRGTVVITGLDRQTGDKARFQGQYYSDKLPGFSLLATVPYFVSKQVIGIPSHPLRRAGFRAYWAADYWVTLFTSGLLTACTGALLVYWSRCLGCRSARAALLGLAYGLATPAYVYATLAYGHQTTAFALFASFFLLWKQRPTPTARPPVPRWFSGRLCRRG